MEQGSAELEWSVNNRATATSREGCLTCTAELHTGTGLGSQRWWMHCVSYEWDECSRLPILSSRSLWDRWPESERGRTRIWVLYDYGQCGWVKESMVLPGLRMGVRVRWESWIHCCLSQDLSSQVPLSVWEQSRLRESMDAGETAENMGMILRVSWSLKKK